MVRAAANERVCGVVGMVVIKYARGEGSARSVGMCRGRRSSACSAWLLASWARSMRVVQGLARFEQWTGSGGGVLACSQTCWLGLVLLLARCRHVGGKGARSLLTNDDNG